MTADDTLALADDSGTGQPGRGQPAGDGHDIVREYVKFFRYRSMVDVFFLFRRTRLGPTVF